MLNLAQGHRVKNAIPKMQMAQNRGREPSAVHGHETAQHVERLRRALMGHPAPGPDDFWRDCWRPAAQPVDGHFDTVAVGSASTSVTSGAGGIDFVLRTWVLTRPIPRVTEQTPVLVALSVPYLQYTEGVYTQGESGGGV